MASFFLLEIDDSREESPWISKSSTNSLGLFMFLGIKSLTALLLIILSSGLLTSFSPVARSIWRNGMACRKVEMRWKKWTKSQFA